MAIAGASSVEFEEDCLKRLFVLASIPIAADAAFAQFQIRSPRALVTSSINSVGQTVGSDQIKGPSQGFLAQAIKGRPH